MNTEIDWRNSNGNKTYTQLNVIQFIRNLYIFVYMISINTCAPSNAHETPNKWEL